MINKITLALVILLWSVSSNAQQIDLEDELIARYLFNENVNNIVQNAYHGYPENIKYAEDRFGNSASCIWLNGINARVTISHNSKMNWDARNQSYSISFWVNATDPLNGSTQGRRILTKWSEIYQSDPYPFSFTVGENGIGIAIREVGKSSSNYQAVVGIFDGNWHMITSTWDHNSQTLTYYYDGKYNSHKSETIYSSTSNDQDIYIGFRPYQLNYFKGYFDDLYFYDRVMNPCEIEALYSGQLTEER